MQPQVFVVMSKKHVIDALEDFSQFLANVSQEPGKSLLEHQ